jgi:hypothetical protein
MTLAPLFTQHAVLQHLHAGLQFSWEHSEPSTNFSIQYKHFMATSVGRDLEHRKDLTNRARFATHFKSSCSVYKATTFFGIVRLRPYTDPIETQHLQAKVWKLGNLHKNNQGSRNKMAGRTKNDHKTLSAQNHDLYWTRHGQASEGKGAGNHGPRRHGFKAASCTSNDGGQFPRHMAKGVTGSRWTTGSPRCAACDAFELAKEVKAAKVSKPVSNPQCSARNRCSSREGGAAT